MSVSDQKERGSSEAAKINWLTTEYLRYLYTNTGSSIVYLNQCVTWSVGAVTAVTGLLFSRALAGSAALLATIVGVSILCHFMARAIRAYVNVMRFSMLSRIIIQLRVDSNSAIALPLDEIDRLIQLYDIEWACPLSAKSIAYKVFLELGFGPFVTLLFGVGAYQIQGVTWCNLVACLPIGLIAIGAELYYGVMKSAYFNTIKPYSIAEKLR